MKKMISLATALIVCLSLFTPALAAVTPTDPAATPTDGGVVQIPTIPQSSNNRRVTIGDDLTAEQRAQIYRDFGIDAGSVPEIIVTNSDERAYLRNLVPEGKIGSVALSCIYIEALDAGSGLSITTNNINWCSKDMYAAALTTAGITDARVTVSAPFPVSGTGALTGAYMAYEDITGLQLNSLAKQLGVEELIVTGELAEYVGSDDATAMIAELKKILDQTQSMTDDQVRAEITAIARAYNISLTDAQMGQLLGLCRSLEKLDVAQLQDRLLSLTKAVETAQKAGTVFSNIANSIKTFFVSVGNFFSRLFGKG